MLSHIRSPLCCRKETLSARPRRLDSSCRIGTSKLREEVYLIPFQYDPQHRGLHCGLYLDPTMTAFWSLGCGLIGTLHRFLCTRYSGGHTSVHVLRDVGCACWSSALLWGLRPAMVGKGTVKWYSTAQCNNIASEAHEADRIPSSAFRLVCVTD